VTAAGLLIRFAAGSPWVVTAGLTVIVAAPIATLVSMAAELRLKGNVKSAALALLTAAVIIASIIVSVIRGG